MNPLSQEQIIEITMQQAQVAVDQGNALERLTRNKDFQLLFEQGYFLDEPQRLTMSMASPSTTTEQDRLVIHNGLLGISQLNQYLNTVRLQAETARKSVKVHEEYLEQISAEANQGEA